MAREGLCHERQTDGQTGKTHTVAYEDDATGTHNDSLKTEIDNINTATSSSA